MFEKVNRADGPIKPKKKFIVSSVMPTGSLVETVYDPETRRTRFAVSDGQNAPSFKESVDEVGVGEIWPLPADSALITKGVVLLPSEPIEYGGDGELIESIQSFIHRYLDVTPFFERVAVYYAMLTWVYDRFDEIPYLRALGEYGSGKSRLLKVVGSICYKPMFVGGAATVSPIFRIIDKCRGTLILDEADYRFSDTTADIVKILNSGYQRGVPVLRAEGEKEFEIRAYEVFGPKIIATRNRFNDIALESRFLVEEMDKKVIRGDIPLNLSKSFDDEALTLRNKLLLWRFRNYRRVSLPQQESNRTIEPRLSQITMPLLSIITDADMREDLRHFAEAHEEYLADERGMTEEAVVAEIVLHAWQARAYEPTMSRISRDYKGFSDGAEELSPRKIGHIVRRKLGLKVVRKKEGFVVPLSLNRARVERLRKKYNIPDNVVNEVNVPQDPIEDLDGLFKPDAQQRDDQAQNPPRKG